MPTDLLIALIMSERVAVAVLWSIIGVMGFAAMTRLAGRMPQRGDMGWSSLPFVSIGLLIFQWGAFTGQIEVEADPLVAVALLAFLIAAVGLLFNRALKAPSEHRTAALASYSLMLCALIAAGALSS